MWRRSFFSVRKLRGNFKPRFAFYSNKPPVNAGIRTKKLKNALLWLCSMSENDCLYLFQREVDSWDSTTWFRIRQFQTTAGKRCLQMNLLDKRVVFWRGGGDDLVSKKRETSPIKRHQSCPSTCQLFSNPLHVFSLWHKTTFKLKWWQLQMIAFNIFLLFSRYRAGVLMIIQNPHLQLFLQWANVQGRNSWGWMSWLRQSDT